MISVEDASNTADTWEMQKQTRPALQVGIALNRGWKSRGEEIARLNAADEAWNSALEELYAAIGVERGQDDWQDFIARVRSAVERPAVEQAIEVPVEAPSEGASHMGEMHFHYPGSYEISIRLEDPSAAGRFDEVNAKLDQLLQGRQTDMATFQETLAGLKEDMAVLQTQVAANTDAENSAATAFHALADQLAQITASATDLESLRTSVQGFTSQLHDSADSLAAAVVTTDQPTA